MNERITDLEIKISFVENTVAELDEVVRHFSTQIDLLRSEMQQLREMLPEEETGGIEEEVPPHY